MNNKPKLGQAGLGQAGDFLADVAYAKEFKKRIDLLREKGFFRDAAMVQPIYDKLSNLEIDRHEAYRRLKLLFPNLDK